MKIDDIPPFSQGYASKLLKRADAELFGSGHVRPSKIESAAGRLAATLGKTNATQTPKIAQDTPNGGSRTKAGRRPIKSEKADTRQLRLKL